MGMPSHVERARAPERPERSHGCHRALSGACSPRQRRATHDCVCLRVPRLRSPSIQSLARGAPAPDAYAGDVERLAQQLHAPGHRGIPASSRRGRRVLTWLAGAMFIEVLRRYLDEQSAGQTGWLAGLRGEVVGRMLGLLHADPGHPWTLDELARQSASSRTNVAKRFTELVGQPPMQYLTQWRMQVAANLLAQSGAKIAAVGAEVGYDSEAAFSRAFKRATGIAPGAWREARRSSAAAQT